MVVEITQGDRVCVAYSECGPKLIGRSAGKGDSGVPLWHQRTITMNPKHIKSHSFHFLPRLSLLFLLLFYQIQLLYATP